MLWCMSAVVAALLDVDGAMLVQADTNSTYSSTF